MTWDDPAWGPVAIMAGITLLTIAMAMWKVGEARRICRDLRLEPGATRDLAPGLLRLEANRREQVAEARQVEPIDPQPFRPR